MKALVYQGPGQRGWDSVPDPTIVDPTDIVVRIETSTICGSDLHEIYDGPITTRTTPHPLTGVTNPVILGHELCGEVVALEAVVDLLILGQ